MLVCKPLEKLENSKTRGCKLTKCQIKRIRNKIFFHTWGSHVSWTGESLCLLRKKIFCYREIEHSSLWKIISNRMRNLHLQRGVVLYSQDFLGFLEPPLGFEAYRRVFDIQIDFLRMNSPSPGDVPKYSETWEMRPPFWQEKNRNSQVGSKSSVLYGNHKIVPRASLILHLVWVLSFWYQCVFVRSVFLTKGHPIHLLLFRTQYKYLLGQGIVPHVSSSSPCPLQCFPPNWGSGWLQDLTRDFIPPSHVTVQSVHSDQSDQLPSTVRWFVINRD